jgi:hypothetical protein
MERLRRSASPYRSTLRVHASRWSRDSLNRVIPFHSSSPEKWINRSTPSTISLVEPSVSLLVSMHILGASHSVLEASIAQIRHLAGTTTAVKLAGACSSALFLGGATTLVLLPYSRFFLAYSCIRGGSRASPPSFPVPPAVSSPVPVNY